MLEVGNQLAGLVIQEEVQASILGPRQAQMVRSRGAEDTSPGPQARSSRQRDPRHVVEVARDGREALEILGRGDSRLVIMAPDNMATEADRLINELAAQTANPPVVTRPAIGAVVSVRG